MSVALACPAMQQLPTLLTSAAVEDTTLVVKEHAQEERAQSLDDLFFVVTREVGLDRNDLPLWAVRPAASPFAAFPFSSHRPEVVRRDVEGVKGGFQLLNFMSDAECDYFVSLLEGLGMHDDGAWRLVAGRIGNPASSALFGDRHNDKGSRPNCNMVIPDQIESLLFERCRHLLPTMGGAAPLSINAKCRCYKYLPGDHIKRHRDGMWSGSRVRNGELQEWADNDRSSMMTFLVIISDGFEGGATTFFEEGGVHSTSDGVAVRTPKGAALCFPHGYHPDSPLHEGSAVLSGAKYIIRSDVLYPREVVESFRASFEQRKAAASA